jgi:Protein of unknown function (DUF2786)
LAGERHVTTQREGLLEKIRGLLAKTLDNGCTESEAMAALDKAHAMMAAYAVSESELNLTREEKAILRREPPETKDPHLIKWRLTYAVARFCGCRAWRERGSKALTFCGLPSDAQLATWMLDTLTAFVQNELVNHLMEVGPSRGERRQVIRNFAIGCTDRISGRLNELREQRELAAAPTSNARALVVVKDAAIQAKLDELGIHLCSGSGLCGASDSTSYGAGAAAGNRASFGRPVSGRNATLRLR